MKARKAGVRALVCGLALGLLGCNGAAGDPVAPSSGGEMAPGFDLPSLDGGNVRLADLRGKVVLVDFWSTTCDPCLREMPELVAIYQARKDKGFEIVAISIDGPETIAKVRAIAKSKNMIFKVLLDPETEVMDRYNPKGEMPFTVVVDKTGAIVLKRSGYQPGDEKSQAALVKAIDGALAK